MLSSGHLFLPTLVTVDLRSVVDLETRSVTWGWKVTDLLSDDLIWVCSHPHTDLLPSGRWLARSLLEGSDIVRALAGGDPFPPGCHLSVNDEDAGAESPPFRHR